MYSFRSIFQLNFYFIIVCLTVSQHLSRRTMYASENTIYIFFFCIIFFPLRPLFSDARWLCCCAFVSSMPVSNNVYCCKLLLKRFTLALVNSIDMLGVLSVWYCSLFAGLIARLPIVNAYVSFYIRDFYHNAPFFLFHSLWQFCELTWQWFDRNTSVRQPLNGINKT